MKKNGFLGFISNTFDKTTAGVNLRMHLKNNLKFVQYIDFTEVQIFDGATTYPIILIAQKEYSENNSFNYIKIPKGTSTAVIDIDFHQPILVAQHSLSNDNWTFKSKESNSLFNKIIRNKSIRDQFGKCFYGIKTGLNEAFIISQEERRLILNDSPLDEEIIKPFYEGKDLLKWSALDIEKYILFTKRGINIDKYPGVKNWLYKYKGRLEPKNNIGQLEGRKPGPYKWYEIQDSVDYFKLFEANKITWANLQSANKFCFDDKGYYINAPCVIFPTNNKAILAILNSKIVWYYLTSICVVRNGGYIEVKPQYFEQIPIPEINEENQAQLSIKAEIMIGFNNDIQDIIQKFQRTIQRKFVIEELPSKLQNWHQLTYADFIKELGKKKIKLSLAEEAEWEDYFNQERKKALDLKAMIEATDKEIDQMVYALYGLTEEEIRVVEGG